MGECNFRGVFWAVIACAISSCAQVVSLKCIMFALFLLLCRWHSKRAPRLQSVGYNYLVNRYTGSMLFFGGCFEQLLLEQFQVAHKFCQCCVVLCFTALCYAVVCCSVLYFFCAVMCRDVPWGAVLHWILTLWCSFLWFSVVFCVVLYCCTLICHAVLCCAVLLCVVLGCVVLWCVALCCVVFCCSVLCCGML